MPLLKIILLLGSFQVFGGSFDLEDPKRILPSKRIKHRLLKNRIEESLEKRTKELLTFLKENVRGRRGQKVDWAESYENYFDHFCSKDPDDHLPQDESSLAQFYNENVLGEKSYFTPRDDEKLLEIISTRQGPGIWKKASKDRFFKGRKNHVSLKNRYYYLKRQGKIPEPQEETHLKLEE